MSEEQENREWYPVAEEDRNMGCPVEVFDGPYSYRCGMGVTRCHRHGDFDVVYVELEAEPGYIKWPDRITGTNQ